MKSTNLFRKFIYSCTTPDKHSLSQAEQFYCNLDLYVVCVSFERNSITHSTLIKEKDESFYLINNDNSRLFDTFSWIHDSNSTPSSSTIIIFHDNPWNGTWPKCLKKILSKKKWPKWYKFVKRNALPSFHHLSIIFHPFHHSIIHQMNRKKNVTRSIYYEKGMTTNKIM